MKSRMLPAIGLVALCLYIIALHVKIYSLEAHNNKLWAIQTSINRKQSVMNTDMVSSVSSLLTISNMQYEINKSKGVLNLKGLKQAMLDAGLELESNRGGPETTP